MLLPPPPPSLCPFSISKKAAPTTHTTASIYLMYSGEILSPQMQNATLTPLEARDKK